MTWRVAPFDRAVDDIVTYVRATYSPIGIVLAGSIVRGEAGPTSDFDVCVVHAETWRAREQKRFAGVPTELFVNPPAQIRRYFEIEHGEGHPSTAHMFATGEPVEPVDPVITELVHEARGWLSRPLNVTEADLIQHRYGAVDLLDDARDAIDSEPASAALLLADAVHKIAAYAFWRRRFFQPRRKRMAAALEAIDPQAAALVRQWAASDVRAGLTVVEALARHVLGVDTFFEWSSARQTVP